MSSQIGGGYRPRSHELPRGESFKVPPKAPPLGLNVGHY